MKRKARRTSDQWRRVLTPDQFRVLREKEDTEPAGTGEHYDNEQEGTYLCAGCRAELFSSATKDKSETGRLISFYAPISSERVKIEVVDDPKNPRTEVMCSRCDGYLGQVFSDGPVPTHLEYRLKPVALLFKKPEKAKRGLRKRSLKRG